MKYIVNPITGDYESTSFTFRDRFDLKDQVADASAAVQGTEQAIDLSVDSFKAYQNAGGTMSYKDFIAAGNEGVSRFFKDGGRVNFASGTPFKITNAVLAKINNLINNSNLTLKEIGKEINFGTDKKPMDSTSKVFQEYIKKYGKPKPGRLKPANLAKNPAYVKSVVDKVKELGSKRAASAELNIDRKTINNILKQKAPNLMKPENVPGPDTGAKAQKKRRILKEKEGTRQLSDSEKLFNKEQEKVVKDLNNDFKKNPSKVLNNSKLINLLNLKLEKGSIVSKNKTKKQILESINRQGGLLDIEHIDDIATGKKNVQYPVNRQITTYNVNSGFLRSVANYINGPNADSTKIANIEKTLKQYGLRVKTNKGIIGAEMISAKDNVKRNLDAADIKYNDVVKPPQSLTKKGLKFAAKQIPLASFLIGTADAATAFKQGVRNPIDLYTAYEVSPEVALKSKAMREDKTGKLLAEEISNLPDISAEASLMDDLTPYGKFLQEGGQLSFEEFQKMQSIPQSDRPITGSIDIPEMDGTMMAAEGGRVNFGEGSPDPDFLNAISAARDNDNIPIGDKTFLGMKLADNPLQRFNEMIDPRAYPYYGQKISEGASRIPEYAGRTIFAALQTVGDLIKGRRTGKMDRFVEAITPAATNKAQEAIGLTKLIEDTEKNRTGAQKQYGEGLEFLAEVPGPATPIGFLLKTPKYIRQLRGLTGSTQAAKKLENKIQEKVAVDQGRRDFNIMLGTGGVMAVVKALGLDKLIPVGSKVAQKTTPIVTPGGTPKYFFDFVNLIKSKGDDISETAATVERQKVYDYKGYTMYEDLSSGEIRINKQNEGVGSGYNKDGEREIFDTITGQEEIMYKPGEEIVGKDGKAVKTLDEYEEATAKPDSYGDMEGEAGLDSIDEILELLLKDGKKYSKTELKGMGIDIDALGNYPTGAGSVRLEDLVKSKKAGGGIMKLAGDDSGPPPTSGPNSEGLALILKRGRKY